MRNVVWSGRSDGVDGRPSVSVSKGEEWDVGWMWAGCGLDGMKVRNPTQVWTLSRADFIH